MKQPTILPLLMFAIFQSITLRAFSGDLPDRNAMDHLIGEYEAKLKTADFSSIHVDDVAKIPAVAVDQAPSELVTIDVIRKTKSVHFLLPSSMNELDAWRAMDTAIQALQKMNVVKTMDKRYAVVIALPGLDKAAVIFVPERQMRAGDFVIKFNKDLKKITRIVIWR